MKKILLIALMTINLFGWEINTHRAINRKAIEKSQNLTNFLNVSGLKNDTFRSNAIGFEGYGMTYIKYLVDGEENGISDDKWKQSFLDSTGRTSKAKELIEAGSILEDAQWQHFLDGGQYNYYDMADGRFVNHFYDAQNGGHALTYGVFLRTDAFNIKILREVV